MIEVTDQQINARTMVLSLIADHSIGTYHYLNIDLFREEKIGFMVSELLSIEEVKRSGIPFSIFVQTVREVI